MPLGIRIRCSVVDGGGGTLRAEEGVRLSGNTTDVSSPHAKSNGFHFNPNVMPHRGISLLLIRSS
jgi:hypothetical protein